MIIDKKKLLNLINKHDLTHSSVKEIEEICDILFIELYRCFENGDSVQYGDYPLFRVKKTLGKIDKNSPRTPRNDRIMVSVKILLDTKSGISNKGN